MTDFPAMTDECHLIASSCKPMPRWAEELRAEHHALKECLKEYMAGFWEQSIVRSKQQWKEEQDSRAFWQNRMMLELGKTFRASHEANQELARLRAQIHKLAQAVERQQPMLEVNLMASQTQQQFQNLAPDSQPPVLVQATRTAASQAASIKPKTGPDDAEKQELSRVVPQPALVEDVKTDIQQAIFAFESHMVDRMDEMQHMHLSRLDAIHDDPRLDEMLKHLQTVGESLYGNDGMSFRLSLADKFAAEPTISIQEQNINSGDPLAQFGKCPSMKEDELTQADRQERLLERQRNVRQSVESVTEPVVVKSRKSVMSASMQFESLASTKNLQSGDPEDGENGQLRELFEDGPVETSVEKCLRWVNYISFFLVVLNALYMGLRIDVSFPAAQRDEPEPKYLHVVEHLFTAGFLIELFVRLALEKLAFFTGVNARWNLFDATIITFQLFEALQIHDLRNTTFVRMVRVARIVKTARALRTLKNLRILRLIMAQEVWTPLFWGVSLVAVIVYLFAVFITTMVMDNVRDHSDMDERTMELYGSVGRTQYTLFMAISGGEAWVELLAPLEAISWWSRWLFIGYMVIIIFGAMNTVSAVYVDALLHFSTLDRDVVMTERNAKEKSQLRQLRQMLQDQPVNKDGKIEQRELMHVLTGDGASLLKALGLQLQVAKALFRLLDVEDAKAIEIDEYIYGLLHLKGNAATIHMATLMYQSKRQLFKLQRISALVEDRVLPLLLGIDPTLIAAGGTPDDPANGLSV